MNYREPDKLSERISRTVSIVFHPVLMPVYGMVIILTAPTLYNYIPFDVKKLLVLIMLVNNVLLPLSIIPFFIHRHVISSWEITDRKDRNVPLILSTVLYIISTYIFYRFPVPYFLKTYLIAIAFISLIATVANFWWKISLHSVAAGTILAVVLVLSFKMYTPLIWFLVPVIVIGGIIMSARLRLGLHDPAEVWIGYFTGVAGFLLVSSVF